MKIGKHIVNFKLTATCAPNGDDCTMDNVPYWKLYGAKNDWFVKTFGSAWRSCVVLTYNELVEWLNTCPDKRVLNAYPRFSTTTRRTYKYWYDKINNEFVIEDDWSCECIFRCDGEQAIVTYIEPGNKRRLHFLRYFYYAVDENTIDYTWEAKKLIEKSDTDN